MSELQSDAFADDLSTDQEDAWRNEETAAASEANLFQKVKEEPETEYLGPEEEPAVDSGRSVESRSDFGIFAEEGKLDNTSSGHIFREEPIKKQIENRVQTESGRMTSKSVNAGAPSPDSQDTPQESSAKRNPRSSKQEIQAGIADVEAEAAEAAEAVKREYVYPPLSLLKHGSTRTGASQEQEVRRTAAKLQQTLDSFGVHAKVTNVSCGPSVTRYELMPEHGREGQARSSAWPTISN